MFIKIIFLLSIQEVKSPFVLLHNLDRSHCLPCNIHLAPQYSCSLDFFCGLKKM